MSLLLSNKSLFLSLACHMSPQVLSHSSLKPGEYTDVIQTCTPPSFCSTEHLFASQINRKVEARVFMFIPQRNSVRIR